jgi:hypothetical protein
MTDYAVDIGLERDGSYMGLEQRINSYKHISGRAPVKGGHTSPWVRDGVLVSEIEASWVQLTVVFSFLLGRTKVYTIAEKVPTATR